MIDFHCHILPGIDDGSQSVEDSLQMIEAQSKQGIDTIIATSHFYADQRSPNEFLYRRRQSWQKLKEALPDNAPQILLGAEVLYFPGMSHTDELKKLCIEGTNILLLEMPFISWPEHMVREIHDLAATGKYSLLLAHMERYYFLQKSSVWDELLDDGIQMQSNAEFFLPFRTRRKALNLLREGKIHILGTDCHNMGSRRPRMDEAMEMIRKRLGGEYIKELENNGKTFLEEAAV